MDYHGTKFEFDLQLFADVSVNMTGAGVDGKIYYAKIGEAVANWVKASDISDALSASTAVTIVAKLSEKVLTVAAEDKATVTITTESTALKDLTVATAKSFKTADELGDIEYPTGTATTSTVAFVGGDGAALGTVSGVKALTDAATSSKIQFDAGTAGKASVTAGCTVGDMTVAESGPAVFTLASSTLLSGGVSVKAGASVKVGANTFTNVTKSGDNPADAAITAEDGTITFEKNVAFTAGDATVANTSTDAGVTITVGAKGVVSKPSAKAVFTVKENGEDTNLTTYTVAEDSKSIVVTGDRVGIYTTTAENLSTVTIAADGTLMIGEAKTAANKITLELEDASAALGTGTTLTTYYTLSKAGAVALAKEDGEDKPVTAAPALEGTTIGYFKVVADWNGAAPTVAVTFVGGKDAQGNVTVDSYLGKVDVNAAAVASVTSNGIEKNLTSLTVSGISGYEKDTEDSNDYAVKVENLYHNATATGADTTTYLTHYALDEEHDTITLEKNETASAVKYYKVTAGEKDEKTGLREFKIEAADGQPNSGDAAYFAVTTTATGTESKDRTYTLTYEANNYLVAGEALDLTDACWAGIQINAQAIPKETATGGVSKIVVTGDTTGTADKYTVVGPIKNGVDVSGDDVISRTFDHTYYSFEPTTGITLTEAAGTKYYGVTLVGNDGNPAVTLTDITNDSATACANGTYAGSYFTVVTTLTDGDVLGKVSISYTNNGNISLKGLTSTEGEHAAVYIPITASSLTADKVSNLSFALPMKNTVEVSVAGLASGINLTEGSTAVTVDKDGKVTSTGTGIVKDTSGCAYDTKNNISVDLASVGEGETAYFVVTSTPDEKLRVNTLTATKLASGEPAATASYYKVKNTEGAIEVTYTKAATGGIDLGTTTSTFTAASEDIDSIAFDGTTVADSAKVTVKNANAALESLKIGSATYSDENDNWEAAKTAEAISFAASSVFVTGKNSIDLSDFANASENTTREYELIAAGADAKGVTKYTIGVAKSSGTYAVANDNFFTVTYNHGEKTVTVTYTPKTDGGIAPATIGALGAISFNGGNLPEGTVKLTLPADVDSFKGTDIKWAITKLPSTVKTVENVDTTKGDSYVYADSYVLGTKNALVLGDTAGTKYYRVTAGEKGALGIHTASIGEAFTPTVPEGSTLDDELEKYNYFQVVTTNNANPPTVVVTYHKATHASEEVEGETVTYTPIVLADSTVEVNPTGALKNARITFGESSDGCAGITYNVTNLVNGQTTQDSGEAEVKTDYVTTYSIEYLTKDSSVTEDTTDTVTTGVGGSINIQGDANKVRYYAVMQGTKNATTGVIPFTVKQYGSEDAAKNAANRVGVITVTNGATGYGVTVSYKGEDLAGMTPSMVEQFTINASGAADTVTTIDLANTAGTIAYAITEKAAGVKVENEGANDTFAADATIALADKLTLAGGETALTSYYIVGEDGTLTSSADEPTKTDNYITVTKNADGTSYEIKYTQASQGTAYTLDTAKSTLTIDASAASETAKITLDDGGIANAITGAKGGVTFTDKATSPNTKISHKTTFAWAAGTYYIPQNEEGSTTLPASGATAYETAAGDDVKYNQVVVTVTEGVYKVAIATNMFEANGTTGVMGAGSIANDVKVITVDGKTVTKFDGAGLGAVEVKGFASGASIVNAQTATTFTGTYTMTIDTGSDGTAAVIYKASAENGTISVKDGAGVNGSFVVGPTDKAFAASGAGSASLATQAKSVWVKGEEGSVVATFENGIITSITGLDETDGEVWVENGKGKTYIYKYEDGVITRRDGSGTEDNKVAAVNGTTTNFINLDYQTTLTAVKVDAAFNWSGDGKDYYFTTTNGVKTTTGSGSDPTSGESYIHAKFAANGTLTLEGVTATSAKTMNPNPDFNGEIKVTPDIAVTYGKTATDNFKVTFIGVKADSTFTGLAADDVTGDTITTAALANGEKVTVEGVAYTAAAADTTLKFTDGKLTDGTVKVVESGGLKLADDSVVLGSTGANAVIAVTTDTDTGTLTISSIKGIAASQKVTVTECDTTTEYQADATDAKKVTKTVTDKTTGAVSTSTLTLTEDRGNVFAEGVTETLSGWTNDFDWKNGKSGIFAVNTNEVEIKKDSAAGTFANDGTIYVEASVTKEDTIGALPVLTLTPKRFNGTELTTSGVNASDVTVTINALSNPASAYNSSSNVGQAIQYNGEDKAFAVKVSYAGNGSVFTNLSKGDVVSTDTGSGNSANLELNGTISVNGTVYKAAAADVFTVYVEGTRSTYLVEGTVTATGEVKSAKSDGTAKHTLAYRAGTESGSDDGVLVAYDSNGTPSSIKDLDEGEVVTVTDAEGKVTTYEAITNGTQLVAYKIASNGQVTYANNTPASTNVVDELTHSFTAPTTTAFQWTDAVAADNTVSPAVVKKDAEGVFAMADGSAAVENQSSATAITYKNYGASYVYAKYEADGTLTLKKQTVAADGNLTDAVSFGTAETVSVTVTNGKKITYNTRGAMKSIAFTGVGADSSIISSGWAAGDSVETAALKKGESVKVGGKTFAAGVTGSATTKLVIEGLVNSYNGSTDQISSAGTEPALKSGLVLLSGTGDTATVTAKTTADDKTLTETIVTYAENGYDGDDAKDIAVTVTNGDVTSITGLNATEAGKTEKFTVTKYTTTPMGVTTKSVAEYTATYISSGADKGIKVTRVLDGVTSTHTFASSSLNILDESAAWAVNNQVTKQDFNWNKVGYFKAAATAETPTVYNVDGTTVDAKTSVTAERVAKQTSSTEIKGSDKNVYLEVTSTMSTSGVATISGMRLVKVNADGTFAKANGTIGNVVLDATDAAGGIILPADTDGTTVEITNAQAGSVFTNLKDEDTVSGTFSALAGVVTIDGKKYSVASVTSNVFGITGAGEIVKGTFTITGEAKSAAEATKATGALNTSVKVTSTAESPDGVTVAFDDKKGITSVTEVDAGETVVVTDSDNGTKTFAAAVDATDKTRTVVTQTIHFADSTVPADLVLTRTSEAHNDVANANVLDMEKYQAANKFDFGATAAKGEVGLFAVTAGGTTIKEQTAVENAFGTASGTYLLVGATKAESGYTINHLEVLGYNYVSGASTLTRKKAGTDVKAVAIAAPTDGNVTLGTKAAALYKAYEYNITTGEYEEVEENSETERTYAINVTGAQAGKAYEGFSKLDSITTDTLDAGSKVTVNGVEWTMAATVTAKLRGDGKAVNGTFAIGSGGVASASMSGDATDFTTKVTGLSTAIVKFVNGEVDSVKGLSAVNDTVTVASTVTATGAVTTTTYKVTAVDSATGEMTVERVETKDGVTTTTNAVFGTGDSVVSDEYKNATATVASKFDWTTAGGVGYFETAYDGSTTKTLTATVTTNDIKAEDGTYYLKVALDADGSVSKLELRQYKDNALGADVLSSVTAGGTITIDGASLPAGTALKMSAALAGTNTKLVITDAPAESVISNMRAGDSLMTGTLAVGEKVYVSSGAIAATPEAANTYTAGAAGFLKFADAAKLVEGTLKFTADQTVTTSKGQYVVDVNSDTVTVKVLDGVVTAVSGLTETGAGTVAVTDANNNVATYSATDVAFTINAEKKDLTTIALTEGQEISVAGNTLGYVVGAAGALKLYADTTSSVQVTEGAVKFTKGGAAASKSQGAITFATANEGNSNVIVTLKDGKVTSITGLAAGDKITVAAVAKADGSGTEAVVYEATSATVVTKKVGTADAVTAYLTTAGGDVISAKYQAVDSSTDISEETNAIEGQLSWADVSGRSTGYFEVKSDKATIAEQAAKVTVKAPKNTATKDNSVTYAVANAATDEDKNKRQTLTIGALKVTTDTAGKTTVTGTDAAALLSGATLTVTAPATKVTLENGSEIVPALDYTKSEDDTYSIVINKVAAGSEITGLEAGDKVTTAALQLDDKVTVDNTGYYAGAKGTLEFLGEGSNATKDSEGAARTPDNKTTLLNGVVLLSASGATTATLSGSKDGLFEDITVKAGGTDVFGDPVSDSIVVTVRNGVVTSITGLETVGATVTVTQTGEKPVTYTLLSSEEVSYNSKTGVTTYNTIIERAEGTDDPATDVDEATRAYASFTNLKNIYGESKTSSSGAVSYTNGYKPVGADTPTNVDVIWSATTATPVYVTAGGTFKKGEAANINAATIARGTEYDVMTVKTANGVTTISKIERMAINAQGVPAAVKGATVDAATIDGTITAASVGTPGTYAKISYKVPTTMKLTATKVGLGSVFTGLGDNDLVTTADSGTFTFGTDGTSVTVYKENEDFGTDTEVYTTKTKGVTATMDGGALKITNFESGSLSVVSTTKAGGKVTTDYAYDSKGVLTKTVTDVNGAKEVYALDGSASAVTDDLTGFKFAANPTINQVVSDFDWTLAKNKTGYFAIANGKATAKVAKTTIKNAASNYLAVTLSDNGVISDVSQMVFDATAYGTHGMKEVTEPMYSGTIAITAPAKMALTFDRDTALNGDSIDATAKVAVTGAVGGSWYLDENAEELVYSGSKITSLKEGDTVTTARLAIANAKTGAAAQSVQLSVDGGDVATFTAGAAGALSFAVANVDDATHLTLTGGTVYLTNTDEEGEGFIYVGDKQIAVTKGDLKLQATKNGETYTISDLTEGETFTVKDYTSGTTYTYVKSGSTLFCTTVTGGADAATTQSVLSLTKTSIASAALLPTAKGWTTYTDANATFTETADGLELVSGNAVTVNLANLDKRLTADKKTDDLTSTTSYEFVIDKYMAAPTKFKGEASVINKKNHTDAIQQTIGSVNEVYVYKADFDRYDVATGDKIGQNIKATDKWKVYGSAVADTITGASKGTDTLIGAAGNDTLVGGNANDTFAFDLTDLGNDMVTKYTTGKDKIVVGNGTTYEADGAFSLANVALVANQSGRNAADVLLHDGTYNEATGEAATSVLLAGMGNGKAVTINDATYYFGNAATSKAMTFTYTEGAYYLADASANTAKAGNTINVTTDKTKATAKTLGDTVTVNLADTEHYVGVKAVNAKSSGNRVYLAAGDTGATLTGGTYQSTLAGGAGNDSLVGGSGSDVFWFDTVEGTDTVTSYTSGKDAVYFGDVTGETTATKLNGLTIKADGKNVVINNGDTGEVTLANAVSATKAVTVLADKDDKTLLSYYVGSAASKAKNNFTATLGTDAIVDNDKNVGLTSYYLGTETANAVDTLSIKTAKGQKTAVNGKFSLADNAAHLSNIDVLDTSAINIAGSKVTLQGSNSGSFTLKGTNGTKVTDRFDLSNLEAGAKQVTLTNLDVGEIIELAENRKLEGSGTSWSITDDSGAVYGTVTLTGASKNAAFTKGTTTDGHVTYTRSVK